MLLFRARDIDGVEWLVRVAAEWEFKRSSLMLYDWGQDGTMESKLMYGVCVGLFV